MRIASLEPFIADLCCALGLKESLVAVPDGFDLLKGEEVPIVVAGSGLQGSSSAGIGPICKTKVDLQALRLAQPDIVLTSLPSDLAPQTHEECLQREAELTLNLSDLMGRSVKVRVFNPLRLEQVYKTFERLGSELGVAEKAKGMAQRAQSQVLDWGDNFYDRVHNKRVTFLSSINPFRLGGFWIPDMIQVVSAVSQEPDGGKPGKEVCFEDINRFKPDVIVVAPEGSDLLSSAKLFTRLQAIEGFDQLPAAKRGEVFFADGLTHFYRPDLNLIDSMGILISCMAGIDSGYITKRDSFYRLRWLELQRHRFT